MMDCMQALLDTFVSPPDPEEPNQIQLDQTHHNLSTRLSCEDRRLLLRIQDLNNALRNDEALRCFTAGLRLALQIFCELHTEPFYDFNVAEEAKAFVRYQEERAAHET